MGFLKIGFDQDSNGWSLGEPRMVGGCEVDARRFLGGERLESFDQPLVIPVVREGERLRFTLGAFNMPVIDSDVAETVQRFCGEDVQLIPALINGESGFYVLNALRVIDCIDHDRSLIEYWKESDHRPEKAGLPRTLARLRLATAKAPENVHMFRLADWKVALIVSEDLWAAMELHAGLGVLARPT